LNQSSSLEQWVSPNAEPTYARKQSTRQTERRFGDTWDRESVSHCPLLP
jgi:hypothetical protein